MYKFTKTFTVNLKKNTGIDADSDTLAFISAVVNSTVPYKKIDNKGRHSEYFTFMLNDVLVTIVADGITKKILTGVIETHQRPQFLGN